MGILAIETFRTRKRAPEDESHAKDHGLTRENLVWQSFNLIDCYSANRF
jgi:hypothetical protein